ncbi:AraC family transcriptional regulator [Bacillus sp. V3-13]|uniref:AraC family transcriptional regulator n=1 Tax=Bacillus sp. V3-13 TaxID=2053728 RepID=UPI0027E49016|nr:AraC family transcriptional regulator [Bacillus sp. V3-13]
MRLDPEHKKAAEEAIKYMQKHLDQDITTVELATHVGYSTYHFIRIFKEITGVTPRHYLSALRIESGKQILLDSSASNLKTLLAIGFRSMGSFSSRFKQLVGLSPKGFRLESEALVNYVNQYKHKEIVAPVDVSNQSPCIHCHMQVPSSFKGLIFVGLFPRPIPDQRPVAGTALHHTKRIHSFANVPPGQYYVLAAGIPWSLNPKNYFVYDKALRGKSEPVTVQEDSILEVNVELREPLPYDPPILVNLPLLLFEKDNDEAN